MWHSFSRVRTKVKNLVHKLYLPGVVNVYEQSNTWWEQLAIDYKKVAFSGVPWGPWVASLVINSAPSKMNTVNY